jgi:plastocyanin
MLKTTSLLVLASLASFLVAGCSSSSSSSGSTTGGTTTAVNTCTEAAATDMTSMKAVTIDFGGTADTYRPNCVEVATGTAVTWSGDFSVHPLMGGTVSGSAAPTVDATSPITEAKASGMSATVTFTTAGTFPYYCAVHYGIGMVGAIFVTD